MPETTPLEIVMIASEAAPYSKTGGLADVTAGLTRALDRIGHRVTLVMPRYRGIDRGQQAGDLEVSLGRERLTVGRFVDGIGERSEAVLIDSAPLYDRDGLYGIGSEDYADNPRRFAVLGLAALEHVSRAGRRPSVVHTHDWQGGIAAVYLKTRYASDRLLRGVPAVFTIHNLAYQGSFDAQWMSRLDLPPDLYSPAGLEFWGRLSFLKGGIQFSDAITTVSPTYAREILAPQEGFGFEGVLAARKSALFGILNGIDTEVWDPAHDPFLPVPFDLHRLDAKRESKRALLSMMKLPVGLDQPVIGMVSRLVEQKGHHFVAQVADELPKLGLAFAVLGSGEARFENMWRSLAGRYPNLFAFQEGYHERLAHLIEGGADMFLMPSLFEPCGLNQMYSHRYGTVPVVRATGGLDDTVEDYDPRTGTGNGFKFAEASGVALLATLRRARETYDQPERWRAIQAAGMRLDRSWDVSAREYVKVYRRLMRVQTPDGPASETRARPAVPRR